jgi:ligand-binding SRPBCC domain-containing protein
MSNADFTAENRTVPAAGVDEPCSVLLREAIVPHDIETTFAFFADAHNLERITPPWLRFRILTPAPIVMREGTLIDYALRLRGIPIRWRTQISRWQPPFCFADRQLKGPYQLWEHTHTFEACAQGTRMTDRVRYRAPLHRLVHGVFVRPEIERIFDYRARAFPAALREAAAKPSARG